MTTQQQPASLLLLGEASQSSPVRSWPSLPPHARLRPPAVNSCGSRAGRQSGEGETDVGPGSSFTCWKPCCGFLFFQFYFYCLLGLHTCHSVVKLRTLKASINVTWLSYLLVLFSFLICKEIFIVESTPDVPFPPLSPFSLSPCSRPSSPTVRAHRLCRCIQVFS